VIGTQITAPSGLHGSGVALLVGALGALYGSIGVAQAVQNAMNVAWAVPRDSRPNPLKARLRSLMLLTRSSCWPGRTRLRSGNEPVMCYGCARHCVSSFPLQWSFSRTWRALMHWRCWSGHQILAGPRS